MSPLSSSPATEGIGKKKIVVMQKEGHGHQKADSFSDRKCHFLDSRSLGPLLNRRNILIMLMPIESMLLAVILNFMVFSVSLDARLALCARWVRRSRLLFFLVKLWSFFWKRWLVFYWFSATCGGPPLWTPLVFQHCGSSRRQISLRGPRTRRTFS